MFVASPKHFLCSGPNPNWWSVQTFLLGQVLKFSISHSSEWIGTNNYHWWCYHDLWQHRPPAFLLSCVQPEPSFVSEDISVMSLQHDRAPPDHHPPYCRSYFCRDSKRSILPYLFKKSLIYPHLFTLPYILTVKAGPVPG